ncbi:hypothetical protein ACHHYP_08187 [Achlya hypogyna]|uniref:glucan 1,3-beta-glucosidase n=1 Tax=Achlya hypogyna TaxID=1202772 RepID=A0A0A7CNQ9_ACHHY|nr:secreted protein [Achlya hypogyna]OQR87696.1 hypothetical protein ACHHYP_08187 [Achlya hypogyna]
MRSAFLLLALVVAVVSGHIQVDIRSRKVPLRGVNLGGWLVAEDWMTQDAPIWSNVPANASALGEYHAMQTLGHRGQAAFDKHRSTFITEADVAAVATTKFNTVRVPVGYWLQDCSKVHDERYRRECNGFAKHSLQYLDALVNKWALKHNVAVLISLHGAPGSQNGKDHSGVVDGIQWGDNASVQATKDFAHFLVERYQHAPAFLGLGLLNEPSVDLDLKTLVKYYADVYHDIRSFSDCILVMMPQLQLQLTGQLEDLDRSYTNVWVEWHPYLIWGYEEYDEDDLMNAEGIDALAKAIRKWKGHPLLFGEWSFVTPGSTFSTNTALAPFVHKLLDTMNEAGVGWTYWTWKVAGDTMGYQNKWSIRNLLHRLPAANAPLASFKPLQKAKTLHFQSGDALTVTSSLLASDPSWIAFFGPPPSEPWTYNSVTKQLVSGLTGLCLDASYGTNSAYSSAAVKGYKCDPINYNQKWNFERDQLVYVSNRQCLTSEGNTSMTLKHCTSGAPSQTLKSNASSTPGAEANITEAPVRIFINATGARMVWYRNASVQFHSRKYPTDDGLWLQKGDLLVHTTTEKCLQSDFDAAMVSLGDCDEHDASFHWTYDAKSMHWKQEVDDVTYCLDARRPTKPRLTKCSAVAAQRFTLRNA